MTPPMRVAVLTMLLGLAIGTGAVLLLEVIPA